MFSFGLGWDYYRHHWETDLLFGFVPKTTRNLSAESAKRRHAMATFTFKQNYIPWRVPLHKSIDFEPLTTGLYISTLLDRDYWVHSPSKYPDGYYFFRPAYVLIFSWVNVSPSNSTIREDGINLSPYFTNLAPVTCISLVNSEINT